MPQLQYFPRHALFLKYGALIQWTRRGRDNIDNSFLRNGLTGIDRFSGLRDSSIKLIETNFSEDMLKILCT